MSVRGGFSATEMKAKAESFAGGGNPDWRFDVPITKLYHGLARHMRLDLLKSDGGFDGEKS
jgi:hypothetical protein